jgi:predicted MPP superfamily phosphohydrolase
MRTGMMGMRISTIIIFIIIFGKFSFSFASLVGRLFANKRKKWQIIADRLAMVCCIFTICCILYSFLYGYKRYITKEVTVYAKGLPKSFDGYRIVQFSDLHIGSFRDGEDANVQKIVNMINAQHPDMIVFTGDLVNVEATELDGFKQVLSQLQAKDGVYSILGNHDYGKYKKWDSPIAEANNLKDMKQKERSFGWTLLLNEGKVLQKGNDKIALLGSENYGKKAIHNYGNLNKALTTLPNRGKGLYKILLTHDPSHWHLKVLPETDIQLTLSGHTHAMQLKLGSFSPCQWLFDEWDGLYAVGSRVIYVDTGVGALMSYRYGAWPQISVLTLRKI